MKLAKTSWIYRISLEHFPDFAVNLLLLPSKPSSFLCESDVQGLNILKKNSKDEDPVLAKNWIRGSVPQTKGDF